MIFENTSKVRRKVKSQMTGLKIIIFLNGPLIKGRNSNHGVRACTICKAKITWSDIKLEFLELNIVHSLLVERIFNRILEVVEHHKEKTGDSHH